MMEEPRRHGASEQTRELKLAAGRVEQVVAADDQRDVLHEVVDSRGELIRPVAVTIADDQVAALLGRALLLRTVTEIIESLHRRLEPHAQTAARGLRQPAAAAGAGISQFDIRGAGSFVSRDLLR